MTSDKAYTTEQRLNALWNALGPFTPATGGGNGQRVTQYTTSNPQLVNSTTPAQANGLAVTVVAGRYRVAGNLAVTIGATSTQPTACISGPAITSMRVWWGFTQDNPAGSTLFSAVQTAISTLILAPNVNQGNGTAGTFRFEGIVNFSAGGTMSVSVAEQTALQTWNLNRDSEWTVETVGQTS